MQSFRNENTIMDEVREAIDELNRRERESVTATKARPAIGVAPLASGEYHLDAASKARGSIATLSRKSAKSNCDINE